MDLFVPCERFRPTDRKEVEPNCVCCKYNDPDTCDTLVGRFESQAPHPTIPQPPWERGN